jgi:titin
MAVRTRTLSLENLESRLNLSGLGGLATVEKVTPPLAQTRENSVLNNAPKLTSLADHSRVVLFTQIDGTVASTSFGTGIKAPTSLTTSHNDSGITLKWNDKSSNEYGFRVYRSTDGKNFDLIGTVARGKTSFTDLTAEAEIEYTYGVAAYNNRAQSALSPRSVHTLPAVAPDAPEGAAATKVTHNSISLSWFDEAKNEEGYHVYRSEDGEHFSLAGDLKANVTSFTDTGLKAGIEYTYGISSWSAGGESYALDTVTVVTKAGPAMLTPATPMNTAAVLPLTLTGAQGITPSSPSQVTVMYGSSSTLQVSWSDNSANEGGFNIYRSSDGVNFSKVGFTWANNCNFTDVNLKENTTYIYKVSAWSSDGEAFSAPGFGTTGTRSVTLRIGNSWAQTPNAPSGLFFTNVSNSGLTVTWSDPNTNQKGFSVYRSTDGVNYSKVTDVAANVYSYSDRSLTAGTNYYYRIGAFNDAGETYSSSTLQKTIGTAPLQIQEVIPTPAPIVPVTPIVPVAPVAPVAPGQLLVTGPTLSTLQLNWSDVSGESGYKVLRSTDGVNFTKVADLDANATSFVDSGLNSSTTYTYKIAAWNAGGETLSGTSQGTTMTPVVAPSAPASVVFSNISSSSLSVSWSDVASNETGYRVYRSTDGINYSKVADLNANSSSFADSGLSSGTTYYYKIAAWNSAGETTASSSQKTAMTAPAAPASITISNVSTMGLTITWNDVASNESGYRVYRSTDGSSYTKVAELAANSSSFSDSGLSAETTYFYKIAAWNSAGEAITSSVAQSTQKAAPVAPIVPGSLAISSATISSLQISWSDSSSNESGFRVYRSTNGGAFTLLADLSAGVTSFSDTGLSASTTYTYKVAAWNEAGETATNAASGTTQTPVIAPNAPASVTFSNIYNSGLTINWSDQSSNESGYRVYRSTDGTNFSKVADLNANSTSYSDWGLNSGATYYYKIAAWNSAGEVTSAAAAQKTSVPAPAQPTWLTVAYPTTTKLELYWLDQSSNESGFHIYRSTDGGQNYTLIGDAQANSQFYADTNLTPGTKYTYKVTAFNEGGENGTWIDSGTTLQVVVAPGAPGSITFANITTSALTLNWTDSAANESGYRVYRSSDGTNFSKIADLSANATSFADSGLSNDTTYYYKIAAWNTGGETVAGPVSQKTLLAAPTAPGQLTVSSPTANSLQLSWADNSSSESGYKVYRSADGWNYTLIGTVAANVTSFSDTGLSANTSYSYKIAAWNGGGEAASNAASGMTLVAAPTAPAAVTFANVTTTAMKLSWNDSAGEKGYRVYRSTDGVNFAKVADLNADTTSYSDTALAPTTTYYYKIAAWNGGGETTASASQKTATPEVAPAQPTWLTVAYPTQTKLELYWLDQSYNESGFHIYRSADGGANFTLIGDAQANAQFFADTNLTPGTTYTYKVTAFNSGGENGTWIASGTTQSNVVAPNAPAALTFSAITSSALTINWADQASNESGYRVYRSTDGVNYSKVADLGANSTSFSDSGLAANATYYYKIAAWNSASETSSGAASQKTASASQPAPAQPTWLTVANPTATKLELFWLDQSNNETGFHIYRSADGGKSFTLIGDAAANTQTFVDNGLSATTTYTYKVTAFNSGGENGTWVSSGTTLTPPPAAPSNPSFLNASYNSISVYWTDNSTNELGFRVYRSADGTNFSRVADLGPGATVFTDTGLNSGTTYYYKIAAWNGNDSEAYSAVVSKATTVAPPSTPSNLNFSSVSTSGMTLSWSDSANESGYRVYRSADGVNFSKVADLAANVTSFADSGLADNKAYYYKVSAWNSTAEMTSTVVSKATNAAPPAAPTALSFSGISASVVTVNWTDNAANENGVRVYRSTDGVNFSKVADLVACSTSFTDTGLNASTTYYYKVSAWNAAGETASSSSSTLTSPTIVLPVSITSKWMTSFNELDITGTTGNDSILVTQAGDVLTVTANGQVSTYTASTFGNLMIRGVGGNDQITVDSSVNIITLIYGGDGNSVIKNLTRAKATIVTIGNGVNVVTGNGINTSYWVNTGDTVNASSAEWALNGINKVANFYQPFSNDVNNSKYVPRTLKGQDLAEPTDVTSTRRLSSSSFWGMGPTMNDINQGSSPDCYFLAPLSSLAYSEPQRLMNTAVDLGDGTYAVRFVRNGVTSYVRVDGDLPYGFQSPGWNGNQWGSIMEKAYAYFRYGQNTYSSLGWGFQTTTLLDLGFSTSNVLTNSGASTILNTITTHLNAGHAMAASTYASVSNAPVVASHVYSVIGAYMDTATNTVMIKLRNPWGFDGAGSDGNGGDGIVTLTYAQFSANFSMLTFSTV